jgi:hypothetical protein
MLNDDDLRAQLTTRLADLDPDVEAELGRVLDRARFRTGRRRTTYAVGLVAAATVIALVLGRGWVLRAEAPAPTNDVPVRALDPERGKYVDPEDLDPRRYRARFAFPPVGGLPDVEIDVPAGWGQDNDSALATAPSSNGSARRIDLVGRVLRVDSNPCSPKWVVPAPGTLGLARALSSVARTGVTPPVPVTLDGHDGYVVRLQGPRTEDAFLRCTQGSPFQLYLQEGVMAFEYPGWTSRIWVLDVEGSPVLIHASHGPDVTPSEETELVGMVESISFSEP